MSTTTFYHKQQPIRLTDKQGYFTPYFDDVLCASGLMATTKETEKLLNHLSQFKFKTALRLVSNIQKFTISEAREKLVKSLLIDLGLRLKHGLSGEQRDFELYYCKLFVNGITSQQYTERGILQMVKDEGIMIEYEIPQIMENNKKLMRISDLYPWTLKNIDSFSLQEQDQVLKNLKDVEWIKQFIQELNPGEYETFKLTIISALENPEMPLHVLSLSAMIYNLKIIGIESSDLEQAVNNSERVRQEAYDMVMFNIEYQAPQI